MTLHHPLEMLQFLPTTITFPSPTGSHTFPIIWIALPPSGNLYASFKFSHRCSPLSDNLSNSPGKANNSSLHPMELSRNLYKALVTLGYNHLYRSVSLTWLCLSFYLNSSTMPAWHRRYSVNWGSLSFPSFFQDHPFQKELSLFGGGGEGGW